MAFTLSCCGCPFAGVIVGTFLGTGLDVANEIYTAKLNHNFSYSIFEDIPKSLLGHFMISYLGSSLGVKPKLTNEEIMEKLDEQYYNDFDDDVDYRYGN